MDISERTSQVALNQTAENHSSPRHDLLREEIDTLALFAMLHLFVHSLRAIRLASVDLTSLAAVHEELSASFAVHLENAASVSAEKNHLVILSFPSDLLKPSLVLSLHLPLSL